MLMVPVEHSSQRNGFSPARMPLQLEAGDLVGATNPGANDSHAERVGASGARLGSTPPVVAGELTAEVRSVPPGHGRSRHASLTL